MSFINTPDGATASTAQPAVSSQPAPPSPGDTVRMIAFGSPNAVRATIKSLHRCRYAEPNDWSRLLPTGRVGEMMTILTKRETVGVPEGYTRLSHAYKELKNVRYG